MNSDLAGKGILLKAESIADVFRNEITGSLAQLSRPPKLVGILSTSASASKFYAESTQKQSVAFGFDFDLRKVGAALNPESGEGEGVEEAIIEANEDSSVDGIMVSDPFSIFLEWFDKTKNAKVYYPIFGTQQVRNYTNHS
jgi:methylenetetrahydrofolate dehydrogenase (NAD+)